MDKGLEASFGVFAGRVVQFQPAHFIKDGLGLLRLLWRCRNPQAIFAIANEVDGIAVDQVAVLANVERSGGASRQALFQRHGTADRGHYTDAVTLASLWALLEAIAGIRPGAFGRRGLSRPCSRGSCIQS